MIFADLYQIFFPNAIVALKTNNDEFSPDLYKMMVFRSILSYKKLFCEQYGNLILCSDDTNCWRKDIFPYYKSVRKKNRDEGNIDWMPIYEVMNEIETVLREYFPFKLLKVPRCESDDIIGVLTKKYGVFKGPEPKILIISRDKDLSQLQYFSNVEQFDPVSKKFIPINNPAALLQQHIIQGDRGDGVPNIRSNDDVFVIGEKQKPIKQTEINEWTVLAPEAYCDQDMLRNYYRNKNLIDLNMIPEEFVSNIIFEYDRECGRTLPSDPGKVTEYFMKNRMPTLMIKSKEYFS